MYLVPREYAMYLVPREYAMHPVPREYTIYPCTKRVCIQYQESTHPVPREYTSSTKRVRNVSRSKRVRIQYQESTHLVPREYAIAMYPVAREYCTQCIMKSSNVFCVEWLCINSLLAGILHGCTPHSLHHS